MKRIVTHFQVTCRDGSLSEDSLNLGITKSFSSTSEFLHSVTASKLPPKKTGEQQLVRAIGLRNKIPTTTPFLISCNDIMTVYSKKSSIYLKKKEEEEIGK
jgi:hypothetical protein